MIAGCAGFRQCFADDHAPRRRRRTAICFAVKEIAPSTQNLTNGNRRRKHIQHVHQFNFLEPAHGGNDNNAAQNTAVNRQTAVPNGKNL